MGVSVVVRGLAGVDTGFRQAAVALRTLAGAGGLAAFDDRLPEALLLSAPDVAGRLVAVWLGPVLALPAAESAELVGTLEAWVATGGSTTHTGLRVHCHRNTVINRLRRVSTLTGRDLLDAGPPVELVLALRALGAGLPTWTPAAPDAAVLTVADPVAPGADGPRLCTLLRRPLPIVGTAGMVARVTTVTLGRRPLGRPPAPSERCRMSRIGDDHTDHRRGRDRSRRCTGAASSATSSAAPPSSPRPTSPWPARRPARCRRLPQVAELYDLEDLQTDAAAPTSALITVTMNPDGTASFALPRMEVGQGITTSTAMIIAEELDLPVERVRVTLAPARPELVMNQLTGGSNTRCRRTPRSGSPPRSPAAPCWPPPAPSSGTPWTGSPASRGSSPRPTGAPATYAELATAAASAVDVRVEVQLKDRADFTVVGTPRNRVDALARRHRAQAVRHGPRRARGAADDGLPAADAQRLAARRSTTRPTVLAMPGVTHVALVETGVAVRAETFGQCIDAIRAMTSPGTPARVEGESD